MMKRRGNRLWDAEASGALTSTTDAVHVYASDDTLVGTLKGAKDEDPAVWEFDLDSPPGSAITWPSSRPI